MIKDERNLIRIDKTEDERKMTEEIVSKFQTFNSQKIFTNSKFKKKMYDKIFH